MLGKACKRLKILLAVITVSCVLGGTHTYFAYAFPLAKHDLSLTVVAMGKKYVYCYPEIDFYKGIPYLKNAEEVVDGIFLDTVIRPIDADVKFLPDEEYPFDFVKEQYGRGINKEDLLLKIERALQKNKTEIIASEIVLKPSITVEKLRKSTYRRAYFTTSYMYSSSERKENIQLCSKLIGFARLDAGQLFSFNETVGERTEERGFKNARIIEKGKFTDGIGGGVCQVSSTVYNAALLAGLRVRERHSHSMAVSYVEPSFDAMVSMGYADLKIENCTGGIVFLSARAEGDLVTVTVYGEKQRQSYKRVSEVVEKISPPEYLRQPSGELERGEERIAVYEKEGLISKGFLEVYKNGKLQDKILLSEDKYSPLQGEILYGE